MIGLNKHQLMTNFVGVMDLSAPNKSSVLEVALLTQKFKLILECLV